MTLGFPTIVIPAIQGGDGHYDEQHPHDIQLDKEQISWFSMFDLIKTKKIEICIESIIFRFD